MATSSTAELAVGASNYTGNAALGGGAFGSFQLDLKPVEDLARYTMLYNKTLFDQQQKDAEAAALEIADYTSYDLTSGIPKDAKLLQEKYDKLTAYVRDNPNALDYKNKKEWAEYKKMRNDLDNDLRGAKVRNTMWALRQKEIQDETNQATKDLLQKELDAEITATDIRTPIKYSQKYADQTIKLPDAPELKLDVTKVGPNAIVQRDLTIFNVPKARANGDIFAIGMDGLAVDPASPEGQRASIERKNNFWLQGADAFNSVINAKDPTSGEFLYKTKITDSATGAVTYTLDEAKLSKLPRNILNLVKETNAYLLETKADIKSGFLRDKFEAPITFGPGALDENDYQEINYQDGISPEELAFIAQYAKWKGDSYKTDIKPTDNALQASAQAETARHNKASEGIGWANVNLEKDKWNAAMKGGETVKNGAIIFSERIYEDLKKLSDENGVISPDKARQLNQEQLKYLGIEKTVTNEDGTSAPKSVFTPLSIGENDAIQIENGAIKVLINAKKLPDGRYSGAWDNTKSTTIYNIATNRLNEELQKAGAKELNAYLPIDLGTGGVSTNTVGGSTTVSGSTTTKNGYSNATILKDGQGKSIEAGVKNGKWYNIKTGEELK